MRCKAYQQLSSEYLDGELDGRRLRQWRGHMAECLACRHHLQELRQASMLLRATPPSDVPRELHSYIMRTVERRAARPVSLDRRLGEWLQGFNPRPLSYLAGALASLLLFALLVPSLRPIPVAGIPGVATFVAPVPGSFSEFRRYNQLPIDFGPADAEYYELPRVLDNSSLVSFSHIANQKMGAEGMAALVEVAPDGHARLLNMIDEPSDPYLIEQLWWSLSSDRAFQPAIVQGRPVSTRIVLLVEKVDVRG